MIYKGSWYFDCFMEFVLIECMILKDFFDVKIILILNLFLVLKIGCIFYLFDMIIEVIYIIIVELDGEIKFIDFVIVVLGMNIWS